MKVDTIYQKEMLAYLAGIIDADGTIGVKKSDYSVRVTKDSTQPTYSERICVKQVELEAVDLLYELFGGYHGISKASAKNGKELQTWQVTDKKAVHTVKLLLPYLRIKKKQAENCLKLRRIKEESKIRRVAFGRGHVGASKRPLELSMKMETIYMKAKELNKVGI